MVEIESLAQFDRYVSQHPGTLVGCRIQAVDLRERGWELRSSDIEDSAFLGCEMSETVAADLRQRGALVFEPAPHLPFDPYRVGLYTPEDLYEGIDVKPYEQTPDSLAYQWDQEPRRREDVLALALRGLHDDSIQDALDEWTEGRRVIGVMGGHALERGTDGYTQAALLGRSVARAGFTVATGGGPGAMEAANLGAYLAPYPDEALTQSLAMLAGVPTFRPDVTPWARTAFAVRTVYPPTKAGDSLSIPTWFYGHEPPNPFASTVAKFFSNALREDVLLDKANAALVILPGAAGTVQEIFQAATPAYYGTATPRRMILVGVSYWTRTLPAWPLLRNLAEGKPMAKTLHLVDTVAEAGVLLSRP
ncbi:MAG TPA: LOG family protein [Actinospica sp.]|nr:LOG family protein [Actinospica sp.]